MIKTVIVDDEPLALMRLKDLLESYSDIKIVAECGEADQALVAIKEHQPDLLLLDVQMPGKNGLELISQIAQEEMPVVIFVTAFDQYAVKAFEIHALDYLLKPFDQERFDYTLQRARAQIERERGGDISRRLLGLLREKNYAPKYLQRLKVKTGSGYLFLKIEEIVWISAEANYLRIHTEKHSYLIRGTLGYIEGLLNPEQFVRIHRSTIVNVDCIKEMHQWFQHGEYSLSLTNGKRLTISRSYRERLMRLVGDFD